MKHTFAGFMVALFLFAKKEDFFNQREIVVLEGSKDGILYVNILLKLYLKSLRHNGKLLLNEQTPLSAEMIALLTRHEVGTVERAMRAFMQPGLVVVRENDIYYMPEIEQKTGSGYSYNGNFKEGESL